MTPDEILTDAEKEAVDMAGRLYTLIADLVVQGGPNREDDLAEIRTAIHHIQHAVMAQAAGRRYPGSFRLLGREIDAMKKEKRNA